MRKHLGEENQEVEHMYSWGPDTSTWAKPGFDFGDAKGYLKGLEAKAETEGPRDYGTKKTSPDLKLVNPKGRIITTESTAPVILAVDGTGSMQTWPAEIFDRLPLFYQTLATYNPATEVSFSVIGDGGIDKWPVQITDFGKDITLDKFLKALKPEGGGGPGIRESYELWAYFVDQNVRTPNAASPFLIIMGDEMFYDLVRPEQANAYLGLNLQSPAASREVWQRLGSRFDIYFLRKPYPGNDEKVAAQWREAIGSQRIIDVFDPTRVVDQAIGIIAKRWGKLDDFVENMSARQDDATVVKVLESLRAAPADLGMKSKLKLPKGGKTMPLLEG